MKRLIVGVILILITVGIWAYPNEPTDSELVGWWLELDRDEQIAELRTMDRALHAQPIVGGAELVVIQTRNGTIHAYFSGALSIDIDGVFSYEVPTEELPAVTVQGNREVSWFRWLGIGLAVGVPVGILAAIAVSAIVF